ncbi:MAG: hypothetical protein IJ795_05705 [Bacteroidales bacterium]|nr:hypothetical protein [Bacteroidales bacterium]
MESTSHRINALKSRQLELQGIMAKSDAHAAKCVKLGKSFQEEYPQEYQEYAAAREEYNRNESELDSLQEILESEDAGEVEE